ncbi:hypothetical protein P153DRAFT_366749 [Dothidotthia symphoricarpi CBS 119687]|uniref:ADP-ribose 1''-phosphate phosphatase n=1 Tax=Dothidotthia symphoricarpi CBS 119687 TaxID=1392245 RepID=A0A6A6AEC8_9PLEO|nr:uncharacterized protein P153DRAFT_366749 [Dothidotthia symphoricarpi CBS 119687]KAF2129348.1 hypothetical protein P153DRAFT_366749 [Dothidotthia symphoricarpi CBS 119687]
MSGLPKKKITALSQPINKGKRKLEEREFAVDSCDEPTSILLSTQGENVKSKRYTSISPPPTKRRDTKNVTMKEQKHLDYRDLPPSWPTAQSTSAAASQFATPSSLKLVYHQGDIFENIPKGCLLIHACNAQGHWGSGIAKAFRDQYPKAYAAHRNFCIKDHTKFNPVRTGTAQLVAPCEGESEHWIGCVFTSAKYGKAKDKPEVIVRNTVNSMKMLLELVMQAEGITEIRMCMLNSGKFGVPWEKTSEALESIELQAGWRVTIGVWEPV